LVNVGGALQKAILAARAPSRRRLFEALRTRHCTLPVFLLLALKKAYQHKLEERACVVMVLALAPVRSPIQVAHFLPPLFFDLE